MRTRQKLLFGGVGVGVLGILLAFRWADPALDSEYQEECNGAPGLRATSTTTVTIDDTGSPKDHGFLYYKPMQQTIQTGPRTIKWT